MTRGQIVAMATGGRSAMEIAEHVGCARSYVYTTARRYRRDGLAVLLDGRDCNGQLKADEPFRETVRALLDQSPREFGYLRPTWTRELLVRIAEQLTGTRVSLSVMGRVLRRIGARRGRPKPIVRCPLSDRQRRRRLAAIRGLLATLPADEVAVYEDEIDIHLNPKIGVDWMNRGQQKVVVTPGKNQKGYLAGTLDARDGTVLWVGGPEKTSALFIAMLRKLDEHYGASKVIHVILDNYGIHRSGAVRQQLALMPRMRLWFLPPYCPDENRIERLWLDLHANVTRNHQHDNLIDLCGDVARFLDEVSPWPRPRDAAAVPPSSTIRVHGSRSVI